MRPRTAFLPAALLLLAAACSTPTEPAPSAEGWYDSPDPAVSLYLYADNPDHAEPDQFFVSHTGPGTTSPITTYVWGLWRTEADGFLSFVFNGPDGERVTGSWSRPGREVSFPLRGAYVLWRRRVE